VKVLEYTAVERLACPRPVDKLDWVTELCRDKRVLDLGAYDETAVELKEGTGWWLHGRLFEVARWVVGVDNSPLLPADGLETSARSRIVPGDILQLEAVPLGESPDVVVAGELIEHVPDPVAFLQGLSGDPRFAGATAVITTPNASAFYNFLLGFFGRESTHHDHVAIHSYKTLNTLCRKAGLVDWQLTPYHARFSEMVLRSSKPARMGVLGFERFVNTVETAFPLLSGGWILTFPL